MKRKFSISISIQISIFLIIVAFIPVAIMMALKTYEKQQLTMLENSNVQQGRIIAAALCGFENPDDFSVHANEILKNMNGRFDSRIRILDKDGKLLSDSSNLSSESELKDVVEDSIKSRNPKTEIKKNAEDSFIYRLFSFPIRVYRKYFKAPRAPYANADYYINKTVFDGDEITAALNGRYGATTRFSTGGQVSVTLYSAIPVVKDGNVNGVVLVSRSTYKILQNLYELRLDLGKIFLRSLLVVLIIALFLAFRISFPLRKLSNQAEQCADKKGRIIFTDFAGQKRYDEIGALSRSFTQLIERLNKRIKFSQAFSSDIAHEFKNPLTAIRSSAEILEDSSISENDRKELCKAISDEVEHLQLLLNGVRNISKIDAGISELTEQSDENNLIPVNQFAKNIINRLKLRYKNVDVEFYSPDDEINLELPPDYFDRLAENLIDNAMSFGTKVKVSSNLITQNKKNGKNIFVFTVEDNGKGINEEQMKKIFDRFYSERNENQKTNHTGLGLSIVHAITDALEGEIQISRSEQLGGAKFTLNFPL